MAIHLYFYNNCIKMQKNAELSDLCRFCVVGIRILENLFFLEIFAALSVLRHFFVCHKIHKC